MSEALATSEGTSDEAAPRRRLRSVSTWRRGARRSLRRACLLENWRGGLKGRSSAGSSSVSEPAGESEAGWGASHDVEVVLVVGRGAVGLVAREVEIASSSARASRMMLTERTRFSWTTARQDARSAVHACGAKVS